MKKSISFLQFVGFIVTSLAGTLLHFLYDWTNQCIFVAPFSAVNESTWEHMKLLFFPMFVFAIIQSRLVGKEYDGFWCIKLKGIALGLVLIPVLFYTCKGIFGYSPDWFNITIFFVAAAAAYFMETRLFKEGNTCCVSSMSALAALCLILLSFIVLTFVQPKIPFFQDPITMMYGVSI